MNSGRLTARNWKFLPMSFLAFDIEGTREHYFDVMTSDPHGHGGILFHETTVENFKQANARFRQADGSYRITNPTRDIALIDLKPFSQDEGMAKFFHYALKFSVKLDNNDTNYSPDNFYPASSPKYPFWQTLGTDMYAMKISDHRRDDANATIEWLRNMASPDHRFRRNFGRDGGTTTPRSSIL